MILALISDWGGNGGKLWNKSQSGYRVCEL